MGDVQTINDTLEASVIPSAVFSVRKYIVPPHSPAKSNKNSSLILLAKKLLAGDAPHTDISQNKTVKEYL